MALVNIFKKLLIGGAFSTERGRIRMFESMDWTLYPSAGLARILQNVGKKLGENFLYELGYKDGVENAHEIMVNMKLKPAAGWLTQRAVIELLDFLGYGRVEFILAKIEKEGQHHIIIHVKDNPIIEHATRMYGRKSMVCAFIRGLFTGHGEMELGAKNGHLKENKCFRKGSPYCEYESKWWKNGRI